ncbi:DUF1273 domain-containing protein [Macrococcus brunensis]|uniref:UPF0398 protein ERX27_07790 n=1 Tax=Macrococcus brunensis TaxID=198483 RepID=A0A4V3BDA2_9STAP|nr:DUF1273 domain-containing protein [Macrococcus brunensis]TDL95557.1 DUF1273 domain-containing protein [Macrococcus brunensis]ULG70999.1 DUF1273 domain-containing protein [Macrococcus brunensis]ULG73336.1 DUF1273 domain-containing protein [Macrococcus brunensis]
MKSLYVTGYKPFELNIFKNNQPEVKFIKLYLQERIRQYAEEGLEWVIISGMLGTELWAGEVAIRLKKNYQLKLAIISPFLEHTSKWNEENQLYYEQILSQADFVTSVYQQPYAGGYMFREATQFILENTEGTLLFYDEEQEASPKYFKRQLIDFSAQSDYNMDIISMDDLSVFINEYQSEKWEG